MTGSESGVSSSGRSRLIITLEITLVLCEEFLWNFVVVFAWYLVTWFQNSGITVKTLLPWWVSYVMNDIVNSIIDTASSFHYDVCPSANKMLRSFGKNQNMKITSMFHKHALYFSTPSLVQLFPCFDASLPLL